MDLEKKDPPSLDRLFYALETFCENLDEGLMPYLPTLMDRLFIALNPSGFSMQLKRVSLSTLGSVASAVKEGLLPYFNKTIEILNIYINSDPNTEIHQLQCYAIGKFFLWHFLKPTDQIMCQGKRKYLPTGIVQGDSLALWKTLSYEVWYDSNKNKY